MKFEKRVFNAEKYSSGLNYIRLKNSNQMIFIELLQQYPIVDITNLYIQYGKTQEVIIIENELLPLLRKIEPKIKNKPIYEKIFNYIKMRKESRMLNLYDDIKENIFPSDLIEKKEYSKVLKNINSELFKIIESIFFKPLWRKKGSRYNIAFSNFKYLYKDQMDLIYYSPSCKGVNETINNGYPFRKLSVKFTEQEIDSYFSLLDVDNIRNNQNIVEPFPFKYLREFINMN